MSNKYKQTMSGTIGAGMKSLFGGSGRKYYILEHKVSTSYHKAGEAQEIIVDQIELGRDPHCQVRFDDIDQFKTVSRHHAAIVRSGDGWKLVHLSKNNKTLLNGVEVKTEWYLQSGDEIQLSVGGPKLGFIIPQKGKDTVNSIGLSRRLSLFRKQALRPYKTGITIITILLLLAIAAGIFFIVRANKDIGKIDDRYKQIVMYNDSLRIADSLNMEGMSKQIRGQAGRISILEDKTKGPNFGDFPYPDEVYFMQVEAFEIEHDGIVEEVKVGEPDPWSEDETGTVSGWIATGFLLEDGKFVTAHHCVEGWLFPSRDNIWLLRCLIGIKFEGWKINAKIVARNSKQEIHLNSKDFHCGSRTGGGVSSADYAWCQTDRKGVMKSDPDASNNLKTGTYLAIFGFPHAWGVDSMTDKTIPILGSGVVAKDGLESGMILLGNKSFEAGHSGSPVFMVTDSGKGKNATKTWTVVGIVSGASSDYGMIVPISRIK